MGSFKVKEEFVLMSALGILSSKKDRHLIKKDHSKEMYSAHLIIDKSFFAEDKLLLDMDKWFEEEPLVIYDFLTPLSIFHKILDLEESDL